MVEDEDVIRNDVALFLGSPPHGVDVTACADVASAMRAISRRPRFDAALVDLGLPDGSGVDVIRTLCRAVPGCSVVVFTIFAEADRIFEALRAGAAGYLLKLTPPERLRAALEEAVAGGAPMSPAIARLVVSSFAASEPGSDALTEREREVLALLARGLTYPDVARILAIGLGTVQCHVRNIYGKLEVSSKAEATAIAIRLGLI
ncbi:MAG: response regulator transcription factor [Labilithrix sp.]|nr:response regulator transcription factor [Labilithrix sp.]